MAQGDPFDFAIARQYRASDMAHVAVATARNRIQLLQRMQWDVPLHEWAEAKKRGGYAVNLLLESYQPGNAQLLLAEGLTPRCPPWATRKYRTSAKNGSTKPFTAASASSVAKDSR